jgi:hypothetical protein
VYAAAMTENLGFYSVMFMREYRAKYRQVKLSSAQAALKMILAIGTGLLLEFGISAIIDSFFLRPLAIGYAVKLLGTGTGIMIGKLAADVSFYIPAIILYEYHKNRRKMQNT